MQITDDALRSILAKPIASVTVAEVVALALAADEDAATEERVVGLVAELVPGVEVVAPPT